MENREWARKILARLDEITGRSGLPVQENLEEAIFSRLDQTEKIIRAIQRYLPKRVTDKILLNPDGVRVEGERRPVTILFGDLSGFTAMSETMDPEQVVEVINQYFDRMVEIAERYGGHIDKFMGDALMVLFGAPVAHEDDALRACLAAIEMQEAMQQFNREQRTGINLAMSIGINSGEVVAVNVGSRSRMEYTVIGDNVNLASRLEGVAQANETVIGENTYRQVKGKIRLKKLPPVKVKGKARPQNVYLILGRLESEGRPAGLRAGSVKIVGRMAEMEAIREAIAAAREGRGRVVAISGEPGIGKSRLAKELELMARDEGFLFLKGKCYSYASGSAYLPFIRQLNTLFEIGDKDSLDRRRERIQERLHAWDLNDFEPFVGSLLGLRYPEIEDLDPEKRKRKTFEGIGLIFNKAAAKQPLVLAYEDLQWSDSLSQELLERMVEGMEDKPILICCDYRPELALPFIAKHYCVNLMLPRLNVREIHRLVSELAGVAEASDQVLDRIVERTEGNPLFVEEVVKHLLAKRLVRREGQILEPSKRFGRMSLPATVAGVVLGRMDRLPEEQRKVLQYAAVVGKEFDREVLADISRMPPNQIQNSLDTLEHFEGLLYGKQIEGRKVYEFNSTTTHEAAYGTLLKSRRRELHGRVGQKLEKTYRDNLEPHLEDLAHHYYLSNFEEKAIQYLHRAGDKARGLYANKEAIDFYRKCILILKQVKNTRDNQLLMADILGSQAAIYRLLGSVEESYKNFYRSSLLARKINDVRRELKSLLEIGVIHHITGQADKARKTWERIYNKSSDIDDKLIQAASLSNIGMLFLREGKIDKAYELLNKSYSIQERTGNVKEMMRLSGSIAQILEAKGEIEQAIAKLEQALQLSNEPQNLEITAMLTFELGRMMLAIGDFEKAEVCLKKAYNISARIGDRRTEGLALGNIGTLHAIMGRYNEAMDNFQVALKAAIEVKDIVQQLYMYINIGCVYQLWGEVAKALEYHTSAETWAQKIGFAVNEVEAARNLGLDHLLAGNYKMAQEKLLRAIELAEKVGDRRLISFSQANLGALLVVLGAYQEAESRLRQALDGARQVGDPEVVLAVMQGLSELGLAISNMAMAREHIDRTDGIAGETQNLREKAYALLHRAELLLMEGRIEAMAEPLAQALQLSMEMNDKVLQMKLDLLTAEKAMMSGNHAESERILSSLENSKLLNNMPDLLWRVYLSKGQLYKRQGLDDSAKQQISLARRTVEGMKPQVPEDMWEGFINNTQRKLVYQAWE